MSLKKEPLKVICFLRYCRNSLIVKYIPSTDDYSQKNNWEYWTENKVNRGRYICDNCLVNLYYNYKPEFRKLISSKKKRAILRQYIRSGTIQRTSPLPTFIGNKNEERKCECLCECECCKIEREREQN